MSEFDETIDDLRRIAERAAAEAPTRPRVRTVDAAIEAAAASLARRDSDIAMLVGDYHRYAQHGAGLLRWNASVERFLAAETNRRSS